MSHCATLLPLAMYSLPRLTSLLVPALLLGSLALGSGGCAGTVEETGHACPCDDAGYVCCHVTNSCIAIAEWTQGMCSAGADSATEAVGQSADATVDAGDASDAGREAEAASEALPEAQGSPDGQTLPEADACGSQVAFDPSGGVTYEDLSGSGLVAFTLPLPPGSDAGDAPDGDATEAGDAQAADAAPIDFTATVFDVDNGTVTYAESTIRGPTTSPMGVLDVKGGIGYRVINANPDGGSPDYLAIFSFQSLTVPQGATLKLVGSLYPVALVSTTTMQIDGVIDIRPMDPVSLTVCASAPSSNNITPPVTLQAAGPVAPGGYAGGAGGYNNHYGLSPSMAGSGPGNTPGGAPGDPNAFPPTPGAGGGHAGYGGAAGAGPDASLVPGGPKYDQLPLDAQNFHGGAGGGGGIGALFAYGGPGGAGGGALRLVAGQTISIGGGTAPGGVDASGCSGGFGLQGAGTSAPGGGGAGGAIVVEAPAVKLGDQAVLLAVGGGGGGPSTSFNVRPGFAMSIAEAAATVNSGMPGCGFPQVAGNGSSSVSIDGQTGYGDPTGCGGGGAAGFILINTDGTHLEMSASAIVSPGTTTTAFYPGGTIALRPCP